LRDILRLPLAVPLVAKGLNAGLRFGLLALVEYQSGLEPLGLLSLMMALATATTFVANAESYRIYLLSVGRHMLGFLASRAFHMAMLRCLVLASLVALATRTEHGLPIILVIFCLTEALLQDSARSFLFNGWAPAFDLLHAVPLAASIIAALFWADADGPVLVTAILLTKSAVNLLVVAACRLRPVPGVTASRQGGAMLPALDVILLSALTALYPAVERISVQAVFGLEGLGRYAIVFAASGLAVMVFQATILQPRMAQVARGARPTGRLWPWALVGFALALFCLAFRNPLAPVLPRPDEIGAILLLVLAHLAISYASLRSLDPSFHLARRWLLGLLAVVALACIVGAVLANSLISAVIAPAFAYLIFSLCLLHACRTAERSAAA
jgi:hypothetical protein